MKRALIGLLVAAGLAVSLAACEEPNAASASKSEVDKKAAERTPYLPSNDVEFNNYNRAQELYDSPESIIWCTTTWGNASAPLVTVPIAGKLTSSSVSYFANGRVDSSQNGKVVVENRSVDGMFHGTPGPYRYGFTPGGQYVDFTSMPTFCTTSLTEFQRQSTEVSIANDDVAADVQRQAEDALKAGDQDEAQRLLEGIVP